MNKTEIIEKCIRDSKKKIKKKAFWTREFPSGMDQEVVMLGTIRRLLGNLQSQLKKELLGSSKK